MNFAICPSRLDPPRFSMPHNPQNCSRFPFSNAHRARRCCAVIPKTLPKSTPREPHQPSLFRCHFPHGMTTPDLRHRNSCRRGQRWATREREWRSICLSRPMVRRRRISSGSLSKLPSGADGKWSKSIRTTESAALREQLSRTIIPSLRSPRSSLRRHRTEPTPPTDVPRRRTRRHLALET
jgi:hypothetical protein